MSNLSHETISKLENFITEQTQKMGILGEIIKELKQNPNMDDIPQEKLNLLNHLNDGHQLNMVNFQAPKEKPSFRSMMATQLHHYSSRFSLFNNKNFSWENLGYKAGVRVKNITQKISQKNIAYQGVKENIEKRALNLGVGIKESRFVTAGQNIVENIVFIGKKKDIFQLKKKFKNELQMIGFQAEDLFVYEEKKYLGKDEVSRNINERLTKKINLENNKFTILEGLDNEVKLDIISKVIWPAISKDLSQCINLSFNISEILSKKTKSIKSLLKFCDKNSINSDSVIHALKINPEILSDHPGYKEIIRDKEVIIKSTKKYDALTDNNNIVAQALINATSALKKELSHINSAQSHAIIEAINSTVLASKQNKDNKEIIFRVDVLEKNLLAIANMANMANMANTNALDPVNTSAVNNSDTIASDKTHIVIPVNVEKKSNSHISP